MELDQCTLYVQCKQYTVPVRLNMCDLATHGGRRPVDMATMQACDADAKPLRPVSHVKMSNAVTCH